MQTECSASEIDFGRAGGRRVVADFDGGMVSSDGGALLLGETDKAIRLVERFAACFQDFRNPLYVVQSSSSEPTTTQVAGEKAHRNATVGEKCGLEQFLDQLA